MMSKASTQGLKLTREQVIAIYTSRETYQILAKRYGISASSVYNIKHDAYYTEFTKDIESYSNPRGKRKLTDAQIIAIAKSKSTPKKIAKKYKVSQTTVMNIKKCKMNTHIFANLTPIIPPRAVRKVTDEQVLEIRNSNQTQTVLAKKYGVTQSAISRIKGGLRHTQVK